jgi:hypothetical protein
MSVELGKSIHEAEKDIAAQKELYAAFLQLMAELTKFIPGFGDRIDIQKGQGLTIERKPKGQVVEDVVEVEKKVPDAIQKEPSWKDGIETLYGNGQNNLTLNDIKAIAGIVRSNRGDTVIGGENLIIKYNGKTLFETDERGQISKHTAVSPEIKEKFSLLQAGKLIPPTSPDAKPSNVANNLPKAQEVVTPSTPKTQAVSEVPKAPEEKPGENKVSLLPDFNTGEKQVVSQEPTLEVPDTIAVEPPVEVERKIDLRQVEQPNLELVQVATPTEVVPAEATPEIEPAEQVGKVRSALNNVGSYIVDRARRDTQTVAVTATQMVSGAMTNLVQIAPIIPGTIFDQYTVVKTMLTKNVMADEDPKLENSIDEFMNQVGEMFNEFQQDDPTLGLSANQVTNDIPVEEAVAPTVETPEQPSQSPEGIDNNVAIAPPQAKPAQLKTISLEDALSYMSSRDDGAVAQDGRGYNLNDSSIGKELVAQIERGEPLDNVQAIAAREMLGKYHRQFAEGGIKLPTTKSVQEQYQEPNPSVVDQRAIFTKQQEKLDATEPPEQQEKVVAAAFKLYFRNLSEEQAVASTQPGIIKIPLPTGDNLVNELSDWGAERISIERDGELIGLGARHGGNYVAADAYAKAVPALRDLKPYLNTDLRIFPEPVKDISLNQPLGIEQKNLLKGEKADTAKPTDEEIKPYKPPQIHWELTPHEEPAEEQTVTRARGRGGR